jgi:hypothetical protein
MSDNEMERRVRCFMDGIDWQHHLDADLFGTQLYPDEESLRKGKDCLKGGCGIVEVEVRLVRWVEPQDLDKGWIPIDEVFDEEGNPK